MQFGVPVDGGVPVDSRVPIDSRVPDSSGLPVNYHIQTRPEGIINIVIINCILMYKAVFRHP